MKKIIKKITNILKKNLTYSFLGIIITTAVTYFLVDHFKSDPEPTLTGVVQEMKLNPDAWADVENDVNTLMADINASNIDAIGLGEVSILVSTKDNRQYHVVDHNNFFTSLLFSGQSNEGIKNITSPPNFQIANIPEITIGSLNPTSPLTVMADIIRRLLLIILILGFIYYLRKDSEDFIKVIKPSGETSFDDVIGAKEAKNALNDVIRYLTDSKKFKEIGAKAPCGILMLGEPGVGKTMLAKALAEEANASFISITGSDFSSKWVGVGIFRVKKLFKTARKNAPCIIFIDEVDGIGTRTNENDSSVAAEKNRIVNQVLVELDGFAKNEGIIVIGATNRAEHLDKAFLREGRMDRKIAVSLPDLQDRIEILTLYSQKIQKSENIDYPQLARLTTGLSPATLAYIVNHAALLALRDNRTLVEMSDFLESVEASHLGEPNTIKQRFTTEERERIAIHESGHAIAAVTLNCGHLEKVTILPRSNNLGATFLTKPNDTVLLLESDIKKRIIMLLAGRNAEIIKYGESSTGAAQDLQEASKLAFDMVTRYGYGLDGALFNIESLPNQLNSFLVKDTVYQANLLLEKYNKECQILLNDNKAVLFQLADELMLNETVSGEQVRKMFTANDTIVANEDLKLIKAFG